MMVILMKLEITDVRAHKGDSAFLIDDGKTAVLYDTGFAFTGFEVAKNIKEILGERTLDYIFLTHSHYDHAAGSAYILDKFPNAKIVASEYTAEVFRREGAKRVMRELDAKFAHTCGVNEYKDLFDNLTVHIPVKDGDTVKAGDMKFTVIELKGHTRCSIGFYLAEEQLLLSNETLGVYDGDKTIVPSYLISYDETIRSIEKVENMDIQYLLLPHYGLLSSKQKDFYLNNAKASAVCTFEKIRDMILKGAAKAEIIEAFKDEFYKDNIKGIYPEDAMLLNTGIMISLVAKECNLEIRE